MKKIKGFYRIKTVVNVKKSIPANVVAVGVPCKVIRPITEADKTTYPTYKP